MEVGETLMILLLAVLVFLVLALTGLVLMEWCARAQNIGFRGINARATPAECAEVLLRAVLDEREYRQLTRRGYLDVASPTVEQRIYRIPAYTGLVRVYEHGMAVRELCIQPVEPLPSADIVAMHKLMIQGAEQEYWARARHYARVDPNLRYLP